MAVPVSSLLGFAIQAAVGIPLVYVLSRALKLAPRPIVLNNTRREVLVALPVVAATYALVTASNLIPVAGTSPSMEISVLVLAMWTALGLAIVFAAARATHQSWTSVGLSRQNLPRLAVLGLVLGVIDVIAVGLLYPGAGIPGAVTLALGFVAFTIVGLSEEIIYRGYLQTRFEGTWGTWVGFTVATVVFAFAHFPGSYVMYSGSVPDALLSALGRLGSGLLFGYFYVRSRNVVPGAIFHALNNWAFILWQIPNF